MTGVQTCALPDLPTASGQIIIYNGSQWGIQSLSGGVTVTSAGVATATDTTKLPLAGGTMSGNINLWFASVPITTGTTQGSNALTSQYSTVSASTTGLAVTLPTASTQGQFIIVNNNGSNAVNIFPATGQSIDALGSNTSFSLPAGQAWAATVELTGTQSSGNWQTTIPAFVGSNGVSSTFANGLVTTSGVGATTGAQGVIQLAGDLAGSGTAAATPRVSGVQGIGFQSGTPSAGQLLIGNGKIGRAHV